MVCWRLTYIIKNFSELFRTIYYNHIELENGAMATLNVILFYRQFLKLLMSLDLLWIVIIIAIQSKLFVVGDRHNAKCERSL